MPILWIHAARDTPWQTLRNKGRLLPFSQKVAQPYFGVRNYEKNLLSVIPGCERESSYLLFSSLIQLEMFYLLDLRS